MLDKKKIISCLPCGLHQPQRNAYFDGLLLEARDFINEQDYHRGHRQMHNALLHGTGTVCGRCAVLLSQAGGLSRGPDPVRP